ncbi:hypothetical protein C1752_02055 [Acaryochloris thomasi RCC1774]|uniref:Uncharacterized protein n=1 Tax=Acaryochloris thomasi RCC1774 TaxID=1764569 RepID=A0A2W1JQF0_9CYAN|nr:hypothetical protein [Acaryochloris thomasi]PZD73635.1 hypothetical protein C1752_02055 [Acaryochloris thomasi RCC1774]
MGKKRINALLSKLKNNHQSDVENSAYIYGLAQGAVNRLEEVAEQHVDDTLLFSEQELPPIDKEELKRRYDSYIGCRRAAKELGIHFSKTPSWEKLICAFRYSEALRNICYHYADQNPHPLLNGFTVDIEF